MVVLLVHWLVYDGKVGWLGRLVGWLVGWFLYSLVGWVDVWLVGGWFGWLLVGRSAGGPIVRSVTCLIGWLVG